MKGVDGKQKKESHARRVGSNIQGWVESGKRDVMERNEVPAPEPFRIFSNRNHGLNQSTAPAPGLK